MWRREKTERVQPAATEVDEKDVRRSVDVELMELGKLSIGLSTAIEHITTLYREQLKKQDEYSALSLWWTRLTFFGLLLSTAATFGLFLAAHNANLMNAESGRAWLGTRGAVLINSMSVGSPITARIDYVNSGHEPAKEMQTPGNIAVYTQAEWDNGFASQQIDQLKTECLSLGRSRIIGVSFPTAAENSYSYDIDSARVVQDGGQPLSITNDILSGNHIITVEGCFVYETDGKVRHTSFCYARPNIKNQPGQMTYCHGGNDAD